MGSGTGVVMRAASRPMAVTMAPWHLTLLPPAQDRAPDPAWVASVAVVDGSVDAVAVAVADRVGTARAAAVEALVAEGSGAEVAETVAAGMSVAVVVVVDAAAAGTYAGH